MHLHENECDLQEANLALAMLSEIWTFIPRLGRSPGEGNGYPLQYSCLENPMDRGAWGVKQ